MFPDFKEIFMTNTSHIAKISRWMPRKSCIRQ